MFFGFDFKRTNNNLDFGGFPVISGNVNLFQLVVGYNIGYENRAITTGWEVEAFVSPGQWLSDQSKSDYGSLRPKAIPTYFYARSSLSLIWRFLPWLETHQYMRGQVANANLLPSEEYGLGGYNTVRGYPERIVNGDYAFVYNGEIRTDPVSIARLFGKKWRDRFQFLGFVDYGVSTKNQISPGEVKTFHLLSIGPGIRYNILPYVTFRSDYGFQLKTLGGSIPHQRLHFSLVVGY